MSLQADGEKSHSIYVISAYIQGAKNVTDIFVTNRRAVTLTAISTLYSAVNHHYGSHCFYQKCKELAMFSKPSRQTLDHKQLFCQPCGSDPSVQHHHVS